MTSSWRNNGATITLCVHWNGWCRRCSWGGVCSSFQQMHGCDWGKAWFIASIEYFIGCWVEWWHDAIMRVGAPEREWLKWPLDNHNMWFSVLWYAPGQTLSAWSLEYSCGAVGWVLGGWLQHSQRSGFEFQWRLTWQCNVTAVCRAVNGDATA